MLIDYILDILEPLDEYPLVVLHLVLRNLVNVEQLAEDGAHLVLTVAVQDILVKLVIVEEDGPELLQVANGALIEVAQILRAQFEVNILAKVPLHFLFALQFLLALHLQLNFIVLLLPLFHVHDLFV